MRVAACKVNTHIKCETCPTTAWSPSISLSPTPPTLSISLSHSLPLSLNLPATRCCSPCHVNCLRAWQLSCLTWPPGCVRELHLSLTLSRSHSPSLYVEPLAFSRLVLYCFSQQRQLRATCANEMPKFRLLFEPGK